MVENTVFQDVQPLRYRNIHFRQRIVMMGILSLQQADESRKKNSCYYDYTVFMDDWTAYVFPSKRCSENTHGMLPSLSFESKIKVLR